MKNITMHKNYAIYIKLLKFKRIIYIIYTHAYSPNVNRSIKMGFSVKAKCIKLISPVSTVRTYIRYITTEVL